MKMNKTNLEFSVDVLIPDFYMDYMNLKNDNKISWDDFHKKLDLDKLVKKFKDVIEEEYQLIYEGYVRDENEK